MTQQKAPPIMDFPRFLRECASRKIDPSDLLARLARETAKLTPEQRASFTNSPSQSLTDDEEPFFPCGWCRQDNGYWNPYCGWWHWWVCAWPGYGCIDCGTDPPPE